MGRYKVDIAGIKTSSLKTLTNVEMKELFIKMHEGDTLCKDTLVNGNLRLVLSIVQRFDKSKYNVDDLFIGKVSVLGIYKGTIKINQLGNTFQYFAELGNIQSQFKRTSEFEEIQESQYPIEQPTYKEFASSGDDSIYHYIDLLAIIQNIHTTK